MANARSNDVVYLLGEWPIIAAPVIAWVAATGWRLGKEIPRITRRPFKARIGPRDPLPSPVADA
jgi:hypothetical protein